MLGLLLSVVFIVLNGFFVAAEFAFVKTRATQLLSRVKKGERRAITAQKIIERLDRYLSVTQFGVTLASLGLGWIGEPAIEELARRGLGRLGADHVAGLRVALIALAFGLLTFMHVLFGELVPKLIAIQRSEATALFAAAPLRLMYIVFKPILWTFERASSVILRVMGLNAHAMNEGTLSEDEIIGILAADAARTEQGRDKVQLLERVMRFSERTARHAMVPRVDVAALPISTNGGAAAIYLRSQQYSRILLTKEKSLDAIAGYLYTKEFLLDKRGREAEDLRDYRRDILFVPETQGLVDVLRNMQAEQTHIAVVVDEYGGTSGIVTMEDLLEEIVGEIRDEFDEEPANIVSVPDEPGTWDVNSRITMVELRGIGVDLPEEVEHESIGAVMLEKLGRLPKRGDRIALTDNTTAIITQVNKRRILRVRIQVAQVVVEP